MKSHELRPHPVITIHQTFQTGPAPAPLPQIKEEWRFADWEIAGLKQWHKAFLPNKRSPMRDVQATARQAMLLALMFPEVLNQALLAYQKYCAAEGIPWDINAFVNKVKARKGS